jgi:hypothetical protein
MRPTFRSLLPHALVLGTLTPLALFMACGGGGSTAQAPLAPVAPTAGSVGMVVTDAPTDNWSQIGVIVRKVALIPQGGSLGDAVTIYDGSADGAAINLVHLDELSELLASAPAIKAQTYDRAVVTIDGNPASVTLVPALDAGNAAQAAIPTSQIVVGGAKDSNGWVALPVFTLETPLVVTAGQSTAFQLDFDLAHPLFIVVHDLAGTPLYTVNFQVRQKPFAGLDQLYLRPFRGQVSSMAAASTSFGVHTVHGRDLTLLADAANKTIFYDLDATPVAANASFTVPANLTATKYVKASARFATTGTLTAVRVWYSSDSARLTKGTPEGHVTKVDTTLNQIRVLTEDGKPVTLAVNAATTFTYQGGATPIGTGTAFLANLSRGFKVHVTVADPTATPMVATSVDIQRGMFEGNITAASATMGFTYTKTFGDAMVETHALTYGPTFSYWNFAYPTLSAMDKMGFAAKAMPPGGILQARGMSTVTWTPGTGWSAKNAILEPTQLSTAVQTITTPYAAGTMAVTFTADGATSPATVTVNLSATTPPLVYEFTRGGGLVTVQPLAATSWPQKLTVNSKVRVFGIPQANGVLDAYVITLID